MKAAGNARKHGVVFADAVGVFRDPQSLTIEDDRHDEKRYVTVGMDSLARLVTVVYTVRGESIRLISAWRATTAEERAYRRQP